MSQEIFRTIHGSRLYGTNTPDSDYDYYVVTMEPMRSNKQEIVWNSQGFNDDVTTVNVDKFIEQIQQGIPQALEAFFSREKQWYDSRIEFQNFLDRQRVSLPKVQQTYMRTIKAFSFGDFKQRRHAVRMLLDLQELTKHGRFNPRHGKTSISLMNTIAENYEGEDLVEILFRSI